jgi:hypothetical protein
VLFQLLDITGPQFHAFLALSDPAQKMTKANPAFVLSAPPENDDGLASMLPRITSPSF